MNAASLLIFDRWVDIALDSVLILAICAEIDAEFALILFM